MKSGTNFGPRNPIYQQFSTQNILNRIGDLRSFFSWVEILGNTNQILVCYIEYM